MHINRIFHSKIPTLNHLLQPCGLALKTPTLSHQNYAGYDPKVPTFRSKVWHFYVQVAWKLFFQNTLFLLQFVYLFGKYIYLFMQTFHFFVQFVVVITHHSINKYRVYKRQPYYTSHYKQQRKV